MLTGGGICETHAILLQERRRCVSFPFWEQWVTRRVYDALPVRRLPSRPQNTVTVPWPVLISHPAEGRKLSWPKWPVTYQDGIPRTVTHPSTHRARCKVTSLIWQKRIPLDQTVIGRWNTIKLANYTTTLLRGCDEGSVMQDAIFKIQDSILSSEYFKKLSQQKRIYIWKILFSRYFLTTYLNQ